MTGIISIARTNLFSDLNNITEYNILDTDYFDYYGFTE